MRYVLPGVILSSCLLATVPQFEPVVILSASFCVRCIFPKLVTLAFVLQTGATKLAIDLSNALYVNNSVSCWCPQCLPMLLRHYLFY